MRLITFDFHNTLASCDAWFELEVFTIASRVAEALSISVDAQVLNAAYRALRGDVMTTGVEISAADAVITVFSAAALPHAASDIAAIVDRLMAESMHDLSPKPGSIQTIRYLKEEGYRLGVISSAAHHDFVEWSLAALGILDQFDFVLTSVKAGVYKSHPEIYRQALALAEAEASTSLHIGDSIQWDVETAARAGMRTGWLVGEHRHSNAIEPDLMFDDLQGAGPVIHQFVRNLI